MILQDAFERAQQFMDDKIRPEHSAEIVISGCEETEEGWKFYYDSRPALEQNDVMFALTGNGPVVVPATGEGPYVGEVFPSS
jgi:hypothetical protein